MRIDAVDIWPLELPLEQPFVISQETLQTAPSLMVRLQSGVHEGFGESGVSRRVLGEDLEQAFRSAQQVRAALLGATLPPGAWEEQRALIPSAAAATAFDMAAQDLWSRRFRTHFLPELQRQPRTVRSSFTITVMAPAKVRGEGLLRWEQGWQVFKLKIGNDPRADIARLAALRGALPLATIRVDANGGLDAKSFGQLRPALEEFGVELLEQPFPTTAVDLYAQAHEGPIPVFLDEGVATARDVEAAARHKSCAGVNLKLEKARGLFPLIEAIEVATRNNLQIMLGCFITTRVSLSALASVVEAFPAIDRVDLDGPYLLGTDPIAGGTTIAHGVLGPSLAGPGHGAVPMPSRLLRWDRKAPPAPTMP